MSADLWWTVAALLAATTLPLLFSDEGGRFDPLSPMVLVGATVLAGYVLPLGVYLEGLDGFSLRYGSDVEPAPAALVALRLVTGGLVAFHVGYLAARGRRPRARQGGPGATTAVLTWDIPMLRLSAGAMLATALLLFAVGVWSVGGLTVLLTSLGDRIRLFEGKNYLFQGINVFLSAAFVWWIRLIRRPAPLRAAWAFWAFLLASLLLVALQGAKSFLVVAAITFVVLYHTIRRRVRLVWLAAGAAVMVAGLTAYALYVREVLASGALQTVEDLSPGALWKAVQVEFTSNFILLQTLGVLVQHMPRDLPWQHGRTFLSLLTIAVPRGLWPAKPLPATGPFTLAFWPALWQDTGTTLPPGLIGEFYMNFGPVGIAAGMLLYGVVLGGLHRRALRRGDPSSVLTYALATALIPHHIRGESVGPTVMLLILLLPSLFLLRVATRWRPAGAPPQTPGPGASDPRAGEARA